MKIKKIDYLGRNWTMFSFRGIFKTDYKIEAIFDNNKSIKSPKKN